MSVSGMPCRLFVRQPACSVTCLQMLMGAFALALTSPSPSLNALHINGNLADLSLEDLPDIEVSSVSRLDEKLSQIPAMVEVVRRAGFYRLVINQNPPAH